jgi:hypothetical protein
VHGCVEKAWKFAKAGRVGLCKKSRGREIEGFLYCFVFFFFAGGRCLSLIRSSEDLPLVSVSWTSFVENTSDHFRRFRRRIGGEFQGTSWEVSYRVEETLKEGFRCLLSSWTPS